MANDDSANNPVPNFYHASAADFKKIPGSPIAYWLSNAKTLLFSHPKVSSFAKVGVGLQTGENQKYIRYWGMSLLRRRGSLGSRLRSLWIMMRC